MEVRPVKKQCVVLALSILPWPLVAQPPAPVAAEREENAARLAEITGRERPVPAEFDPERDFCRFRSGSAGI